MKRSMAAAADIDVRLLPYNDELLDFLRLEAELGRKLILATGADINIADKVARHLQIFDAVLASDGTNNLTGEAKRRAIESALNGQPFAYAGNDRSDLDVWRHAESAIVVGASPLVAAAAKETKIEAVFPNDASQWRLLLKAMRPYQWCKNSAGVRAHRHRPPDWQRQRMADRRDDVLRLLSGGLRHLFDQRSA